MADIDPILEAARAEIAAGTSDFAGLLDRCLETTDLAARAAAEDFPPDDYLFYLFDGDPAIRFAEGDTVYRADDLADGLVFTHRLTAHEIDHHMVEAVPDLSLLDLGVAEIVVDGVATSLEFAWEPDSPLFEHGCFVGPDGWLAGYAPGDLVAFRRRGAEVEVEAVADVADGDVETELLKDGYEEASRGATHIGVDPFVLLESAVLSDDRAFRAPVRPVAELLADAGLEVGGAFVGPVDVDWEPPGVVLDRAIRGTIAEQHRLERCCIENMDTLIEQWRAFAFEGAPDLAEANEALQHGISYPFWDYVQIFHSADPDIAEAFASELIAASDPDDTVVAHHLRALVRNYEGAALEAEADLETALRIDPDYAPVLFDLAHFASDRGDADRTVSLLRRAGVREDDPMLSFHLSVGSPRDVGRNEPCPCGSGRKYKQCHLGTPVLEPADRIQWLTSKLSSFVTRPPNNDVVNDLIEVATEISPDLDIDRMETDQFFVDLAAYEAGLVGEFLEQRGALLPPEERDLAELWTMARLGLWDVVDTDGVYHLTLRDTRTADVIEVTDRAAATTVVAGEQILARPIEGLGGGWLTGMFIRIDPRHRPSVLDLLDDDPEAEDFAAWYGWTFSPPTFTNREGEPIESLTATFRPATSWDDLTAALAERYHHVDDDLWQETVSVDGESVIRAFLERRDDDLVVGVNSRPRLDRVVEALDGHAELVDVQVGPSDEEPIAYDQSSDELAEVAAELQVKMEERWLDEEVPALGGVTPRQAAADPTRRQDLINLLRTFDSMVTPGGSITMRPDALRQALNLPPEND